MNEKKKIFFGRLIGQALHTLARSDYATLVKKKLNETKIRLFIYFSFYFFFLVRFGFGSNETKKNFQSTAAAIFVRKNQKNQKAKLKIYID